MHSYSSIAVLCRRRALLLLVPAVITFPPAGAVAQRLDAHARAENLLANAAIGAATGGIGALLKKKSVKSGLLRGAAGGGAIGVAKQITADGFDGSGALGRMVNSVGVAAITAAPGDTLSFLLPIGPLTMDFRPRAADRLQTRLNVWTTAVMTAALIDRDTHFDPGASLSTGALVFDRPDGRMPWNSGEAGFAYPGVIFLNRDVVGVFLDRRQMLAHEAIHVLQWDTYHATVTRPVERAALARLRGGNWINRHIEINALAPLTVWGISSAIAEDRRPWEREAYRLTGTPLPFAGGRITTRQ